MVAGPLPEGDGIEKSFQRKKHTNTDGEHIQLIQQEKLQGGVVVVYAPGFIGVLGKGVRMTDHGTVGQDVDMDVKGPVDHKKADDHDQQACG
jgi:hypothetical protein